MKNRNSLLNTHPKTAKIKDLISSIFQTYHNPLGSGEISSKNDFKEIGWGKEVKKKIRSTIWIKHKYSFVKILF